MKRKFTNFAAVVCLLLSVTAAKSQTTTLIDPAGDGGFETGTTFAANGWTQVNPSNGNRSWYVGTGQTGYIGARAAFIGNNATTVGSTTGSRTVHFYKSITLPSNAVNIKLAFQYKQAVSDYSSTNGNYYDYIAVYTSTATPVNGSLPSGTPVFGPYPQSNVTSFTPQTATLPNSIAGTTTNLIFTFNADGLTPHGYGAIDSISLTYETTTCIPPSTPVQTSLSATNATVDWTENGTASQWEIEYGATGFTPGTGTTITTSTKPYLIPGLSPNTTYQVYVRSICGGANGNSVQSAPLSITTLCSAVTSFPFTEGFETTTVACWKIIDGNADGDQWTFSTTNPRTGSRCARLYTDFNSSNNDYLITPQLVLPANQQLRFWVRAQSTSEPDELSVLISTTGTNISDFTTVLMPSTPVNTTSYVEKVVDLSAYSGNVYIAFVRNGTPADGYYLHLDDITIQTTPSCTEPTIPTASNVLNNSATINWIAPASAPSSYEVYYSTTNTAPDGTTTPSVTGINSATTTLTGLMASTTYYVWVRANCGSTGTSIWSTSSVSFTTACDPVTAFPFNEGFETTSATVACWKIIDGNNDGDQWTFSTTNPRTGSRCARLYTDFNSSNNDYLISPLLTLPANQQLRFWVRAQSTSEPDEISVRISTTGSNIADFTTVLLPSTPVSTTTYVEKVVNLANYSGNVYIAFVRNGTPTDGYYLHLDDVSILSNPSCIEPASPITSNITNNSAAVSWTTPTTVPASYEVYYSTTNTAPTTNTTPSITGITATSTTITGLAGNTTYYVWLRSACSAAGVSSWTNMLTFTTNCNPVTSFPFAEGFETTSTTLACWKMINGNNDTYTWGINTNSTYARTGSQSAAMYTDGASSNNDYFVSPQLILPANQQLRFWVRARSASEPDEVSVKLSTTGNDIASFTNTIMASVAVASTTYAEYIVNLSAYSGNVYIAFVRNNAPADGWYLYLDDVSIQPLSNCAEPTAPTVSSTSTTGATVSWTPPATAPTTYELYYSTSSTAPTAATTPSVTGVSGSVTTTSVTGLTPGTNYYVWVRSNCGGTNGASIWSTSGATFTTQCIPVSSLPWTENFDNMGSTGAGIFPTPCWVATPSNPSNPWTTGNAGYNTYNDPLSAPNYLTIYYGAAKRTIWTPAFQLTAGTSYTFNFSWVGDNTAGWNGDVLENTSADTTGSVNLGSFITGSTTTSATTYTPVTRTFTPATTGSYYFGIRAYTSTTAPWYLGFDDFSFNLTTPLSIELKEITAQIDGNRNLVAWSTAKEDKGDYFVLEHSENGIRFTEMENIAATGKASYYTRYDNQPYAITYYRIALHSNDGKTSYSKTVSANRNSSANTASFGLTAYPNPASEKLTVNISGDAGKNGSIQLLDITGKLLQRNNMDNIKYIQFSLSDIPTGIYLVRYKDDLHTETIRFTKQ